MLPILGARKGIPVLMEESLPPLGIHIEEEVDIAEILGGPPSEDPGDSPDEGEPDEPEAVV